MNFILVINLAYKLSNKCSYGWLRDFSGAWEELAIAKKANKTE